MAAGGSSRFLGEEVNGKWTRLLGHFETRILHTITQDDLNAAAQKLYPNTQYDTREFASATRRSLRFGITPYRTTPESGSDRRSRKGRQ